MTERTEIRITGFGGQGVVLSGHIIGRACAVHADMHATMIQSFGPEARGSACSTTLAVSDTEVLYPYIGRPDVFVVMSAEGYDKYRDELADDGTLPVGRQQLAGVAQPLRGQRRVPAQQLAVHRHGGSAVVEAPQPGWVRRRERRRSPHSRPRRPVSRRAVSASLRKFW